MMAIGLVCKASAFWLGGYGFDPCLSEDFLKLALVDRNKSWDW